MTLRTFREILASKGLDPARTLARPDLADIRYRGMLNGPQFISPIEARLNVPLAGLLSAPNREAEQGTQVLLGEELLVLDVENGFAFCQLKTDDYVGYMRETAITFEAPSRQTARLIVPSSHVYPEPNIKTRPTSQVFMGSLLSCTPCEKPQFVRVDGSTSGFVWADHVGALEPDGIDFVSVAELFLQSPYLWGGRSCHGLDCSALVQLSLSQTGVYAPRDTSQMWDELGNHIYEGLPEQAQLQRGDLIFWQGHVGILQSPTQLLHANGYHMQVRSEPLQQAVERIAAHYGEVRGVKRLANVL